MKSIRLKFIINMILLTCVITVCGSILIAVDQKNKSYAFLERSSLSFAKGSAVSIYNLYSDTLGESTHKFFSLFKNRFFEIIGDNSEFVRIAIVGRNGKVILDSLDLESEKSSALNLFHSLKVFVQDKNLVEALQSEQVSVMSLHTSNRNDLFLNSFFYKEAPKKILGDILQIVVPKKEITGEHIVSLVYWISYENIKKEVAKTVKSILFASLILFLFAIILAFYLANRVTKPVKNLMYGVKEIRAGNLDVELPVHSKDELGVLSLFFNQMSKSLKKERESLEKRVEERTFELNQANRKLQEIDKAKTRFFGNISHELRTPLTLILTPIEAIMLGDFGESIEYKDEIFDMMKQNCLRLSSLIDDLLSLSRLENGKMPFNRSKILLDEFFKCILSTVKASNKEKEFRIEKPPLSEQEYFFADRGLLEKAVFNLISNAIKFTDEKGVIEIGFRRENKFMHIWVKDNGIGIRKEDQKRIFQRFERVEEKEKIHKGSGIGLAFVKEIMVLHKGKVELVSDYGKGSCFSLYFSLHEE